MKFYATPGTTPFVGLKGGNMDELLDSSKGSSCGYELAKCRTGRRRLERQKLPEVAIVEEPV
jgi:hypothetical protein